MTGPAAASPCDGTCRIDDAAGWCVGCMRTLDEIAGWGGASAAERRAILSRLPGRRTRGQGQPGQFSDGAP